MSRVGAQPVSIPEGVEITIENGGRFDGQKITVKGSLGELTQDMREEIVVKKEDSSLVFERKKDESFAKALHGLYRSIVSNMIEGVTKGFKKELEMVGIGYKAQLKGNDLEITVGATHPFTINPPEGISFEVNDKVNITVKGSDKQLVGQVAAEIRDIQKPEPYKGKGIRYKGEYVRRKPGKAAKAEEGEE